MKTTTYAEIETLAYRKAGWPRDKAVPSDTEDFRDALIDNLEDVWPREAWPETCMPFVAVTVANGQFVKDDDVYGDLLALASGGNPATTTTVELLTDWAEADGLVRVDGLGGSATLYAEFQLPVPTVPDFGDAALGDTEFPVRFKQALARLCAADLCEDEDPIKAERLRARAERELIRQATRFNRPRWRR